MLYKGDITMANEKWEYTDIIVKGALVLGALAILKWTGILGFQVTLGM